MSAPAGDTRRAVEPMPRTCRCESRRLRRLRALRKLGWLRGRSAGRGARLVAALLPIALLVGALPGCASVDRYMRDRLFDVTDVVDFKYGHAVGVGAKAEATLYLGAGFGLATVDSFREWYGRRATDFRWDGEFHLSGEGIFAHLGFIGSDGGDQGNVAQGSVNAVALNVLLLWGTDDPPMIDRWRFGAEVLLPGALGGMYLNFGELYDLFAGVFGGDPAQDDGLPKR